MHRTIAKSMLAITSASDPNWTADTHNPADFSVDMNNTMKTTRVVKVCPALLSIPRMFPNISRYNNVLRWYARPVITLMTGMAPPQDKLLTVGDYTIAAQVVIPEGIYNIDQILAIINPVAATFGQTWTFNTDTMSLVITTTAPGVPAYTFGYYTGASPVTGTVYMPLYYISGGATESLSTLGLQKAASETSVGFTDTVIFDRAIPNTFDATRGTVLDGVSVLATFDRPQHSYDYWLTNAYTTPMLNSPNLAGPETVHVLMSDLGDSSTIDATTGILYDNIGTVEMTEVEFGGRVNAQSLTSDAETIDFQHHRSVTGFRVRLVDAKFRALTLPRNVVFSAVLTLWYQTD